MKRIKGQSSLEYIIVASFVIIAITAGSFFMWQSGIFDPPQTDRGSTGFSTIDVEDWGLFLEPNEEIGLVLTNKGGESVNITRVRAKIGNISVCSDSQDSVLVPGARETRELTCNQPVSGYTIGDFYQANVEIEYEARGSAKSTSKGKVWGAAEKGRVTVSTIVTTSTTSTTMGASCDGACNDACTPGCSVNQDPDCGCKGGDGCCGIGCTPAQDSDCASCITTCPGNEPGCLSSAPSNAHVDSSYTCCSGGSCYVCDSGFFYNSTSGMCESTCTGVCDGSCPAGCDASIDPDCSGQCLDCSCSTDTDCSSSCAAGDGCCLACASDPDCAGSCTPDGCNNNCPSGCTGADDPDCPGVCMDCSCPTDNDCSSSCAAGDGCCPSPSCSPPDPDCAGNPTLSCFIENGPCGSGETCIYRMSSVGSHAGTCSGSSYPYRVCCSVNIGSLGTDCASGDGVLSLSSSDNAHVEEYNTGSYPVDVCLSHSTDGVSCSYGSSCSYACLGSMSSFTNAHVSHCGGFNQKICCRIN